MDLEKLMVVEHGLQINRGSFTEVLLRPNFRIPADNWDECESEVMLIRPDGSSYRTLAKFSIAHFNISSLESTIADRWKIVVVLKDTTSLDVPEGTIVYASLEICRRLINQPQR